MCDSVCVCICSNSTPELLVAHLCAYDLREECASVIDYKDTELHRIHNTQVVFTQHPPSKVTSTLCCVCVCVDVDVLRLRGRKKKKLFFNVQYIQ